MDIPEIVEILPTNLPAVEANEMRLDNLFRLKDGTIVIVDYESTYSYADKIKYLNYVARTTKRYGLSEKQNQPVRMIVIYTGSIRRGTTRADVDMGCLQFTVEEVFLSDLDAQEIETRFQRKIHSGEILSDEEQMQFIILPLVHKTKEEMQDCIVRCFEMAKKIDSPEIQRFLLSGLIVFTDKVIRRENSESLALKAEISIGGHEGRHIQCCSAEHLVLHLPPAPAGETLHRGCIPLMHRFSPPNTSPALCPVCAGSGTPPAAAAAVKMRYPHG